MSERIQVPPIDHEPTAAEKSKSYIYDKPLDAQRANYILGKARSVVAGQLGDIGPQVYDDLPRILAGIEAGTYGDEVMHQEVAELMRNLPAADMSYYLKRLQALRLEGNIESAQDFYAMTGDAFQQWEDRGVAHDTGPMKELFEEYQRLAGSVLH